MTHPASEVAEIARGLTEAQRNAVHWLSEDWFSHGFNVQFAHLLWSVDAVLLRPAIIEHRAVDEDGWPPDHQHRLTPLGIAVRAHLTAEGAGG